jgi:hypothetical protein
MFKNTPPIHLYLFPVAMFIIGGVVFEFTGWGKVMGLIYGAGILATLHLFASDIIEKVRQLWFENTNFYDTVRKLDPEVRYELGLTHVKGQVDVKIDKTEVEGNELSLSWRKLPLPPWKMKIIAQSCLGGTVFTIRQWAGDGKLLSDPEWRELKDALLNLNFLVPRNDKDPRQGFEWTDAGKQMLEQCVASPLS